MAAGGAAMHGRRRRRRELTVEAQKFLPTQLDDGLKFCDLPLVLACCLLPPNPREAVFGALKALLSAAVAGLSLSCVAVNLGLILRRDRVRLRQNTNRDAVSDLHLRSPLARWIRSTASGCWRFSL